MNYPNNDLWTVRSIDLLEGALEDMKGKTATYYPNMEYGLTIPGIAEYDFVGVIDFKQDDRTIMFEHGKEFGIPYEQVIDYLNKFGIKFTEQE